MFICTNSRQFLLENSRESPGFSVNFRFFKSLGMKYIDMKCPSNKQQIVPIAAMVYAALCTPQWGATFWYYFFSKTTLCELTLCPLLSAYAVYLKSTRKWILKRFIEILSPSRDID